MRLERKYLAHFIDSTFGGATPEYFRLGKHLEELNQELNPDVEITKNILGEQSVIHNGYEAQDEIDPYYADTEDPVYEQLLKIANERLTGEDCKTTVVDVFMDTTGKVTEAWKEDVYVVPKSIGGDTSGVQIPFTIYRAGNREKGTFNIGSNTFTKAAGS